MGARRAPEVSLHGPIEIGALRWAKAPASMMAMDRRVDCEAAPTRYLAGTVPLSQARLGLIRDWLAVDLFRTFWTSSKAPFGKKSCLAALTNRGFGARDSKGFKLIFEVEFSNSLGHCRAVLTTPVGNDVAQKGREKSSGRFAGASPRDAGLMLKILTQDVPSSLR